MLLFLQSVLTLLIVAIPIVFFKIFISVINDDREIKAESKKNNSGSKSIVRVTSNAVDDDGIVESAHDKCTSKQCSSGSLGSLDIQEYNAVSGEADSREKYVQTSSDETCGVRECKGTSIDESPESVILDEIEVDSVNDDEVCVVKSEEIQVSNNENGDEIDGFVRERLLDKIQCKENYTAEIPAILNLDEIEVDSVNDDGVCVDKSEEIQVCADDEVSDSLGLNAGEGGDEIGVIMDDVVVKETFLDEEDDWEGIERTDLEKVFGAAVVYLTSRSNANPVSSLGSDAKMRFYGLHKIATEGPCHQPQPMAFKVTARTKWNAWHQLGNMSPEMAMELYIVLLSENITSWMQDGIEGKCKWDFADAKAFMQSASNLKTSISGHPGKEFRRTNAVS